MINILKEIYKKIRYSYQDSCKMTESLIVLTLKICHDKEFSTLHSQTCGCFSVAG